MSEVRTIAEAHRLFRSKELKPSELLEQCLRRIAMYEPTIKAWVNVYEGEARQQAAEMDGRIARWHGKNMPPEGHYPLVGIPVGIKDIIDVADWPTACGSPAWANSYARSDSVLAEKLRAGGSVFVGKTHTAAYALFDPPPTRNPWNPERTPGGSSSGSAAAVAAGMCFLGIGTQTGGSTIRPASYCGVASYKPTYSKGATEGMLDLAWSLDHPGFMAPTVEDLSSIYDETRLDYSEHAALSAGSLRVGRLRGYFADDAERVIQRAMDELCANLRSDAFAIGELRLPPRFGEVLPAHRTVMLKQARTVHWARFPPPAGRVPAEDHCLFRGGRRDG